MYIIGELSINIRKLYIRETSQHSRWRHTFSSQSNITCKFTSTTLYTSINQFEGHMKNNEGERCIWKMAEVWILAPWPTSSSLIFGTALSFFHSLLWQCSPFWRNQLPRWSWLWPRERWPSQRRQPRTEGSGQSGDGCGERRGGRLSQHNHNRPKWSPTETPHHSEERLVMPGQMTTSGDLQE